MSQPRVRRAILLGVLLVAASEAVAAEPRSDAAETAAQSVADTVMSPFCPGRTLSACPSDDARKLRHDIGGWFEEGMTDDQVRTRLTQQYGAEITGAPTGTGLGIFAWLAPVVFVVVGALVIAKVLFVS